MTRPNILWIISDDTAHRELGHGGGEVLSPNLDDLAANGVSFNQFHCASSACAPSRYNYLTGHYGGRCPADSFRETIPEGEPYPLLFNTNIDPDKETTIAEAFRQSGYFTGFCGKWHGGAGTADMSFAEELDKDADIYDPHTSSVLKTHQQRLREIVGKCGFDHVGPVIWGNHGKLPRAANHHNVEYTAKGALDFLEEAEARRQPFFLNVALSILHAPDHAASLMKDPHITAEGLSEAHLGCMPPRSSIYERITNAHLDFNHLTAGVLWMDDCVGALMSRIREMGVEENTVIVFSTDHGPTACGKFTLYQPGVRIPFIMQWKGRFPANKTIDVLAQNIDLAPTLCDIADIESPDTMVLDGRSLLPAIDGSSGDFDREDLFFEYGYTRGLRFGKWKYIAWRLPERLLAEMQRDEGGAFFDLWGRRVNSHYLGPNVVIPCVPHHPHFFDPDQLYNLEEDPEETRNLAEDPAHASTLGRMKQRLQSYLNDFRDPFNVTEPPDPYYFSENFRTKVSGVRERYDAAYARWLKHQGPISGVDKLVRTNN